MFEYDAKLAQSYAIGGSGVREGEETDNAKAYKEAAEQAVVNAKNVVSNVTPTALYSSSIAKAIESTTAPSNITLTKSIAGFKRLKIFMVDTNGFLSSAEFYINNNSTFTTCLSMHYANSAFVSIINSMIITINGTAVTHSSGYQMYQNSNNAMGHTAKYALAIYRIEGYTS